MPSRDVAEGLRAIEITLKIDGSEGIKQLTVKTHGEYLSVKLTIQLGRRVENARAAFSA